MKTHNQQYYLKQCRKCLIQIQLLSPEDKGSFLRLKKKAGKYLLKAKEFEVSPTNQSSS